MSAPIPNKILTTAIVASGALLIAAAPPNAMAMKALCQLAYPAHPKNTSVEPLDAPQQALVNHLARRYSIASEATERMVAAAYRAAQEVGLDPLLVLAVISIESRFNPIAESVMGAKGLMRIIPKYHLDKLRAAGGEDNGAWRDNSAQYAQRVLAERARLVAVLRSI